MMSPFSDSKGRGCYTDSKSAGERVEGKILTQKGSAKTEPPLSGKSDEKPGKVREFQLVRKTQEILVQQCFRCNGVISF